MRQKPSRQIITAARRLLTHRWWHDERKHYELVVSQYVIDEASAGDPILAAERLESLDGILLLSHASEIPKLADEIMSLGVLPEKAQVDALHIAVVAHHQIQYLTDVELQAYCECKDPLAYSRSACKTGHPHTHYLHSGGVVGR